MRTLLAMPEGLQDRMFSAAQQVSLAEITGTDASRTVPDLAAAPDEELAEVEVLVTGWGSPAVDPAALARMPRLRAIVHTAGTVRSVVTDAVWDRGDIVVTSATEVNAVPVADYGHRRPDAGGADQAEDPPKFPIPGSAAVAGTTVRSRRQRAWWASARFPATSCTAWARPRSRSCGGSPPGSRRAIPWTGAAGTPWPDPHPDRDHAPRPAVPASWP